MNTTPQHDGIMQMGGNDYWIDASGALVPAETVKAQDKLQDEFVRKIIGYGRDLSAQMGRFKTHTFGDVGAFVALLAQEYQAKPGGKKGNMSFVSYNGCQKVQVAVADQLTFGPELQVAKSLVDECLNEWGAESRAELRAVVISAFNVDKAGQVNRNELFKLLRLDISEDRWQRAMQAIRDSMKVIGSRIYVRLYERATVDGPWQQIPLDLANAPMPAATSTPSSEAA